MGTKILAEKTLLIDEGAYDAEIVEYEEKDLEYGPTLVITFEIKNDEDFEGEEITGMCSFDRLTPNTKLWKWAKAANCEPVIEEEFDLDDLIGETVSISVEHQKKDGNTYHRVESVTPLRKKRAEESDDDDDDAEAKEKERKAKAKAKKEKERKAKAKAKKEKERKAREREEEKGSDDDGDDDDDGGDDDYFDDD